MQALGTSQLAAANIKANIYQQKVNTIQLG